MSLMRFEYYFHTCTQDSHFINDGYKNNCECTQINPFCPLFNECEIMTINNSENFKTTILVY